MDLEVVNGVVDREGHAEVHLQVLRALGPVSPSDRQRTRSPQRNGQGRTQAYADKTHQHLSCVPPVPRELPPDDATDDMPLPPRAPLPAEAPSEEPG